MARKLNISTTGLTTSAIYKKLSLQLHPDKGGDTEEFKKLNATYTLIKEAGMEKTLMGGRRR
jgi:DnaJ-class molecular chaperone